MNVYLDYDSTIGMPSGFKPYPSLLTLAEAHQASVTLLMFESTLILSAGYSQTRAANGSCDFGLPAHERARVFGDRPRTSAARREFAADRRARRMGRPPLKRRGAAIAVQRPGQV